MENKYQEALEIYNEIIKRVNHYGMYTIIEEELEPLINGFNVIKELVDKATPKKPQVVPEPYDDGITDNTRFIDLNYCDICGSLLRTGECCPNNDCRQAIDWSE